MKNVKNVMNEMKLRLGWGVTGQQDIGDTIIPYRHIRCISAGFQLSFTQRQRLHLNNKIRQVTIPNSSGRRQLHGTPDSDFAFLNNRITASVDYYLRKSKDLLSYVSVPSGSSTTNMMNQNIGTLKNEGIEFSITARPIVTNDFTWTASYNVAYNKNRITKLNNDGSYIETGGISSRKRQQLSCTGCRSSRKLILPL